MRLGLDSEKQNNKKLLLNILAVLCVPLNACTHFPKAIPPSEQHIAIPETTTSSAIPPLAVAAPLPPPPKATKASERYSIVVNNVLAQEILFALARDAKLNIEIHPGITGTVTMNLIDRTLPEILDAIARQVDMRYELNGVNLAIMPDSPFLKSIPTPQAGKAFLKKQGAISTLLVNSPSALSRFALKRRMTAPT